MPPYPKLLTARTKFLLLLWYFLFLCSEYAPEQSRACCIRPQSWRGKEFLSAAIRWTSAVKSFSDPTSEKIFVRSSIRHTRCFWNNIYTYRYIRNSETIHIWSTHHGFKNFLRSCVIWGAALKFRTENILLLLLLRRPAWQCLRWMDMGETVVDYCSKKCFLLVQFVLAEFRCQITLSFVLLHYCVHCHYAEI